MEPAVAFASLTICVDAVEAGRIQGSIRSPLLLRTITFEDLGRGILRADEAMNGNSFPQAYMRLRSFGPEDAAPIRLRPRRAPPEQSGSLATFNLRIRTRRRAEWQGVLSCPDGSIEFFSSILSLLRLIDRQLEALRPAAEPPPETETPRA